MNFVTKMGQINSFKQLIGELNKFAKKQSTLVIGIDGCGGSGKSTFADNIKKECSNVTIVHMDDFYLPSIQIIKTHPTKKLVGADVDWKRVLNQVLIPISQEKEGNYQRYDWETDELAEWQTVPVGGIVIIESVYSIRKELTDKYDFRIWIECPRETRLRRGLDRDGEEAHVMWENNWMISEDIYIKKHEPYERADIVVDGTK